MCLMHFRSRRLTALPLHLRPGCLQAGGGLSGTTWRNPIAARGDTGLRRTSGIRQSPPQGTHGDALMTSSRSGRVAPDHLQHLTPARSRETSTTSPASQTRRRKKKKKGAAKDFPHARLFHPTSSPRFPAAAVASRVADHKEHLLQGKSAREQQQTH